MIREISIKGLCEILKSVSGSETCSIDSIGILIEGEMKNIKIGSEGLLDLYIDITDQKKGTN